MSVWMRGFPFTFVETNDLTKDELRELEGCSITPDDLKNNPEAVQEVARFSMNLRLQTRKTVDTFINDGSSY